MNSQAFADWLTSLALPERFRALALVYSAVTVNTRQLFLPSMPEGKEQTVINMLHGVNEIHHTLANYLLRCADQEEEWTPHDLSEQLLEIANQYRIGGLLSSAIEFARTRDWTPKT
jgi:hypothetical protein